MAVLIPNATLGVRRRYDAARDAYGQRQAVGWAEMSGLHDGLVKQGAEADWVVGLDPDLWPVRVGDLVVASTGAAWLVLTADLLTNAADPTVDWVRCTAAQRSPQGTVPGGAWFVARYAPGVGPVPNNGIRNDVLTGEGPPPEDITGLDPGTEYLDTLTGVLYKIAGGTP